MVLLNENLQIIDNPMEDSLVVRNRGGRCIVKYPPLFSEDGKYVYVLSGWCVSAYSVQTGDCAHQYATQNKEDLVYLATYKEFLLAVSLTGNLTVWKSNSVCPENVVKLNLKDNAEVVRIYPVKSQKKSNYDLVVAIRERDKKDLQLLLYSNEGYFLVNYYLQAEDNPYSVAVSDEFITAFNNDRLITTSSLNKNAKKNSMLAGGGRWWTVVVCAPEGRGMAAGDNSGRILYWSQPLQSQARSTFHWHTLPVTALTFSPSGSYMYSGGGEGVMVRWNLEVSTVRNFLPRLPAPIVHLAVSPDNQFVAIATQDNSIQLADSQLKISSVIQKLTWGVCPVEGTDLFPAGLVWDPRSRSLVLNGRPGHLQFFNTDDNKLLYNLDITGQNFLTQERHKVLINAEVTHVAISHDGKWMVTVETRDDHEAFLETLLKFWQYKVNARQFSLNTCIQLPHQGCVRSIRFQPPGTVPDHYLLVSTGSDGKFRLWLPSVSESIHSEGLRWVCDSVGYYRNLTPECAAFSSDGSILGVTFHSSLTLWDAEISKLDTSLTRDNNVLKALEFGSRDCCHLVLTASDSHLIVWSILTLSVIWIVPVRTALLCADPFSTNMAVFTSDNSVFVFSPSNPKPLYKRNDLCKADSSVVAAIFVPRPQTLLDISASWCANSQLHFIDSNQELQYVELESEQDPEQSHQGHISSVTQATPFSIQIAKQSTSTVKREQGIIHEEFGTAGDSAVRKLLSAPAHTMPNIHLFCASFLKSLAVTRKSEEERKQKEESEKVQKMEVDDDSDSDNVAKNKALGLPTKKKRKKSKKQKNTENQELDKSPKKELKETPSKKKQRRKPNKEKKSLQKRKNSFTIDDLDTDWLSVFENR